MDNSRLVSGYLKREGLYPWEEVTGWGGLRLEAAEGQLLLQGSPADLIDLADLLVSLAMSGTPRGQHWHLDAGTLLDGASPIPELVLLREEPEKTL